jgi:RND family efflux transporter MFP subunit
MVSSCRRLALCIAGCAIAACSGHKAAGADQAPPPPKTVSLVAATTIELPRAVPVTGTLAAFDELVSGFQVPGRLVDLRADVGAVVHKGDLLAALERFDFELEVARAEAAFNQARARLGIRGDDPAATVDLETTAAVREAKAVLADARQHRERLEKLVTGDFRSQADLDAAIALSEVAESRLQRAREEGHTAVAELEARRLEVEQAKKRLQDAVIHAPWDGRVQQRHAAAGQYLAIGAPVLTVLRIDPLRLRLQVPERSAADVAVGQAVTFTVDGQKGEHGGKVVRLGPAIDRLTRTLLVEAEVQNGEGILLPGGFCRARIVLAPDPAAVALPRSAIISFAGVDRAFTVKDGKAQQRLLTLGQKAGELVEIRNGITAGEQVIADPRGLVHGSAVQVEGS